MEIITIDDEIFNQYENDIETYKSSRYNELINSYNQISII